MGISYRERKISNDYVFKKISEAITTPFNYKNKEMGSFWPNNMK